MDKAGISDAEHYNKMVNTPVSKLVITLGIPTTLSMLITNIYNMADTYFVGTLGNSASGAVGVVFGLMAIIQAFGFMYGHGAGSIIARRLGEGDLDSAHKFASLSFISALVTGAVICIAGLCFINPLMSILGSTDTILPYAADYGRYILLAAPFSMASFVLNNILRYEGKASLAMIGIGVGAILNIAGDPLFIYVLNMGIAGAGLSTALSQAVSFLILLTMFLAGKTQSKISFKNATFNSDKFSDIIRTGFSSLIRQGLSSISTMMLNKYAGVYGDAAVAAMSVVNRISFFIFAVGLGIGQGFQPVSAFNYGAKKYSRVRKAFLFTVITGEILLGILAVAGMIFSGDLVGIFRDDAQVIAIGTVALRFYLVALFFQPLAICSNMLFQSIGENKKAAMLSTLRSGLVFIPVLVILAFVFDLTGIQAAQPVADVITFFITLPLVVRFIKNLPEDE
ncbi:MAG: MATE family efflux transporter [Clostridia bacterium]|nr:MATE family efflux transporter [Clostridia bacterium]